MRTLAFALMTVLSVAIAGYAFVFFAAEPNPTLAAKFRGMPVAGYSHVFGSAIALLVGPAQLHPRLRARWSALHRVLGRIYVAAVFVGGVSGGVLALHADHGPIAQTGFAMLALAWLVTTTLALVAIRRRDIERHRHWIVLSFALTFAAVTLRLYLPIGMGVLGLEFPTVYRGVAWLCWVPNLVAVAVYRRLSR